MSKAKHVLQQILEDAGLEVRSYSGRAMYGAECLAVEVSDLGDLLAGLVVAVAEGELSDVDAVETSLRQTRTDSMGRDIVVYWPGTPHVSDDEEEDEPHNCPGAECCTPA